MKIYPDVLIIGGGVIGSSICYYLSKKGIQATLVEKSNHCSGASGSCDGFVFLQSKKNPEIIKLTHESLKIFSSLADELSSDIEFQRCGGLVIYTGSEYTGKINNQSGDTNLSILESNVINIPIKVIEKNILKTFEPFISRDVIKADFCEEEGHVNPLNLNFGFAEAARKNGAGINLFEEVISFEFKASGKNKIDREAIDEIKAPLKITKVITNNGNEIIAGEIVCACGAWSNQICLELGFDIPVIPRKGVLIVTETLPQIINHVILDYDYICCKFDENLENGFTIEQTKSGNLIIGSSREFAGFDRNIDFNRTTKILNRAAKIFPFLQETNIIRIFSGFRPYSSDGLPFMGKVPGYDNFWLACGHEGDGIALSPVTGQLMAELIGEKIRGGKILNNFLNIDINKFNPGRITAGH
jgi:glycine/D-amino acid oxidase-like deaminating enzyme